MGYTEPMISFMVFVFGLAVGSFLSAFVYRLEKGESALRGRSYCPHCKHSLAWYDLIPLLSFVLLKGACRYCKEKISLQYPLIEIVCALIFVAIFSSSVPWLSQGVGNLIRLSFPQVLELLYLWAVASALLLIFVYDIKHYLIPDKILYPAIGLVFLYQILGTLETLVSSILAGVGAAAFFLAVYLVSKGQWMGFGDVKLALLLGLFLGWPSILVALFFAFCLGAALGVVLVALKKKGLKSEVPFAPFLIMGTAIAFFLGSYLIHWYLNLILV
jgi:prepilin signal peptidase PulO-like enzyme (type II secretory pathway)